MNGLIARPTNARPHSTADRQPGHDHRDGSDDWRHGLWRGAPRHECAEAEHCGGLDREPQSTRAEPPVRPQPRRAGGDHGQDPKPRIPAEHPQRGSARDEREPERPPSRRLGARLA